MAGLPDGCCRNARGESHLGEGLGEEDIGLGRTYSRHVSQFAGKPVSISYARTWQRTPSQGGDANTLSDHRGS